MKKIFSAALGLIGFAIGSCSVLLIAYLVLNPGQNPFKEEKKEGIVQEEKATGSNGVSLAYSKVVNVDKNKKKVEVYVKNPGKSGKKIKVSIIILENGEEKEIAQSEIISNGYTIYDMDLKEDINFTENYYKGYIRVFYYDLKTEAQDIVDTSIDAEINVK